jgi:hypothetical protein
LKKAVNKLRALRLLVTKAGDGSADEFLLHPYFKNLMKQQVAHASIVTPWKNLEKYVSVCLFRNLTLMF